MKVGEISHMISGIQNFFSGLISRLHTREERNNGFEHRSTKITQLRNEEKKE